jgi:hypothetical protein
MGSLALLWVLDPVARLPAQESFVEVLHLRDGSSFQGIVVEQTPGVELRLRTTDGQELSIAEQDVLRLERQPLPAGASPVVYRDVVLLKEGVIFKGLIVEQIPAVSVTLAADNGVQLLFRSEEIWRLSKEERLAEQAAAAGQSQETRQVAALRLELQLQITTVKRQEGEKRKPAKHKKPGTAEGDQKLNEEVEALKQELEGLKEEQRDVDRQEAQTQEQELQELVAKIRAMIEAYKSEEPPSAASEQDRLVQGIEDDLATVDSLASELENRSSQLQREQDQRFQKLSATVAERKEVLAAKDRLKELLSGKAWTKRDTRKELGRLVSQLPLSERRVLYESFKRRDQLKGAGLNLVPFLNTGSWMQKDNLPALLGNLLSIGGIVLVGIGWDQKMGTDALGPFVYSLPNTAGYAGFAVLAGSYTLSILEPFRFVGSRNRALARILRLSD